MSTEQGIQPFRVDVPQAELDELARRLDQARWPDELPGVGWSYGVGCERLREIVAYWRESFDWRVQERRLNALAQYTTVIDDQLVHFVHVRSSEPHATPLLITHGWPSTIADFTNLVGPLVAPSEHHAAGAPAFHVVAPSLPGYGFSGHTRERGWGVRRTARAWVELMRRLGYHRYLAQGGDYGSLVSPAVGQLAPEAVMGVHVNAMTNGANVDPGRPDPFAGLSPDEVAAAKANDVAWQQRWGYAELQQTRPQTLAYALTDSPLGLLAWILDLEWVADEHADGHETPVEWDAILTDVTIYWVTRTAGSSARLYKEHGSLFGDMGYNPLPTAVGVFPGDSTLRGLAERHHHVVRFTEFHRGGHFASLQAPDLLVEDLRAFRRQLDTPPAAG